MDFKYVRIQGQELAENTLYAKGIFSMCWGLIQNGVMEEEDADLFREIDAWFAEILPWPPQCQRRENVVCFFKTENTEMMMKLITPAMWLLEKYSHPFYVVYTNMPGEIVYEDDYQVVVKAGMPLKIEKMQPSWSEGRGNPEDEADKEKEMFY
ncbi:MAG: hypothetical protein IJI51_02920 [Lachnospiraceae bacterium]|nr:hypothetical protein [Lachnospiraceae bacterium]